ncbi:MAG: hypothetical protein GX442_26030 [Candidatus Riflebacteria bacterium]|nr:hypothetical protein [Candidatus Riflebacteria bacterium]
MPRTSRAVLLMSLLALVTLTTLGCGGGGGGGGGTTAIVEAPIDLSGLAQPSSFSSSGFPVTQSTVTIPSFPNTARSATVFVNPRTSGSAGQLGATLGTVASLRAAARPSANGPGLQEAPGAAVQRWLRAQEAAMPPVTAGRPRGSLAAAPRAVVVGEQTTFQLPATKTPTTVTAVCRKITPLPGGTGNVCFFLDTSDSYNTTTQNLINTLSTYWTDQIYGKVRSVFGAEPGAEFNGVALGNDITVLITSKLLAIDPTLAGFFYSGDLYQASSVQGGVSNERKMFYITRNAELTDITIASTMAHEFQHMVNFYQRKLNGLEEAVWLNEAMSGYSEHVCGFSAAVNNQSKALQINMYFEATTMPATSLTEWAETHAQYGLVYMFGTWLGSRFSPNKDGTVSSLLASRAVGENAVAAFTGTSFEKAISQFFVALYVNNQSDAVYGIPGLDLKGTFVYGSGLADVTLTGPQPPVVQSGFPYNTGSVSLAPRAAFAVELSQGNGSALTLNFAGGASAFEMHK